MKKIYPFLFCVLNASVILAQPTISSSWAPSGNFGSNITVTSNTVTHSPGAAGSNCIWNLNSWSSPTSFNSLDTCQFTVSTVDYPGTTDLITETPASGTYYRFHKLSGSSYQNLGYDIEYFSPGDYDHFVWTTPIDLLHFPVSYNDQFITNGLYNHQWEYGSSIYFSHGGALVLVSVDGYGTLNTPMGSFVNVLRIHSQENYTDSVLVSFQNWNITTSGTDRYDWISPDLPGIIIASTSTYTGVGGTTYYSYYSQVTPTGNTGIDELTGAQMNLQIFPQPVTANTKAHVSIRRNCQATMVLSDMKGRKLLHQNLSLQTGNNDIPLDVKDLANGMYTLTILFEETVRTECIIVCNQ